MQFVSCSQWDLTLWYRYSLWLRFHIVKKHMTQLTFSFEWYTIFFGMVHMPIRDWFCFFTSVKWTFHFSYSVELWIPFKNGEKMEKTELHNANFWHFSNLQINSSLITQNQYFSNEICFVSFCWSVSYSSSQFFIHKNCLVEN